MTKSLVIVKVLPNREEGAKTFAFCLKLQTLDNLLWEEMGVEDDGAAVDGE